MARAALCVRKSEFVGCVLQKVCVFVHGRARQKRGKRERETSDRERGVREREEYNIIMKRREVIMRFQTDSLATSFETINIFTALMIETINIFTALIID